MAYCIILYVIEGSILYLNVVEEAKESLAVIRRRVNCLRAICHDYDRMLIAVPACIRFLAYKYQLIVITHIQLQSEGSLYGWSSFG